MEKDHSWRHRIPQIRKAKLDWLLANIDVSKYDPYNPRHIDAIIDLMVKAGVLRRYSNRSMVPKTTENLLIDARKIRGVR